MMVAKICDFPQFDFRLSKECQISLRLTNYQIDVLNEHSHEYSQGQLLSPTDYSRIFRARIRIVDRFYEASTPSLNNLHPPAWFSAFIHFISAPFRRECGLCLNYDLQIFESPPLSPIPWAQYKRQLDAFWFQIDRILKHF